MRNLKLVRLLDLEERVESTRILKSVGNIDILRLLALEKIGEIL